MNATINYLDTSIKVTSDNSEIIKTLIFKPVSIDLIKKIKQHDPRQYYKQYDGSEFYFSIEQATINKVKYINIFGYLWIIKDVANIGAIFKADKENGNPSKNNLTDSALSKLQQDFETNFSQAIINDKNKINKHQSQIAAKGIKAAVEEEIWRLRQLKSNLLNLI